MTFGWDMLKQALEDSQSVTIWSFDLIWLQFSDDRSTSEKRDDNIEVLISYCIS